MTRGARVTTLLAAAWTSLYVISKLSYAMTGRLGVTGGPEVSPASYAEYGPGEVAAAQSGNAVVGVLGVLLLLATLTPVARRVSRWILTIPLILLWLLATAGGIGMLGRALLTESGGALFGAYCVVWSVLVGAVTLAHHRRRPDGHQWPTV